MEFKMELKKGISKLSILNMRTELTMIVAFVVVCVVFTIKSPYFLTMNNMLNIGLHSSIIGVSATGMTVALVCGGFDISVGAIMALTSMVCAAITQDLGLTSIVAIAGGLACGLLCGVINGALITVTKINPLITTLSTASIFRGIAYLYNNGLSVIISNPEFKAIGRKYILGIPTLLIIMVVSFVVMWYVMRYTPFGRKVYAVGGNEEASRFSGINNRLIRFSAFTICGFMAGISGIMMAAQAGAGIPTGASGYEMDIISACVLGGISTSGGKGSIIGSFFGILLLGALQNGMTLCAIPTFVQMIIKGSVLLAAVALDNFGTGK